MPRRPHILDIVESKLRNTLHLFATAAVDKEDWFDSTIGHSRQGQRDMKWAMVTTRDFKNS